MTEFQWTGPRPGTCEDGKSMALFHHHHVSLLVTAAQISLHVPSGCRGDKESLLQHSKQLHLMFPRNQFDRLALT